MEGNEGERVGDSVAAFAPVHIIKNRWIMNSRVSSEGVCDVRVTSHGMIWMPEEGGGEGMAELEDVP